MNPTDKIPFSAGLQVYQASGAEMAAACLQLCAEGDSVSVLCQFALRTTVASFVAEVGRAICGQLPNIDIQVRSFSPGEQTILAHEKATNRTIFFATITFDNHKDIWETRRLHFRVTLWGNETAARAVRTHLVDKFGSYRIASIQWWYYEKGNEARRQHITMETPPPFRQSYFPWLPAPAKEYFERYMADSASVLFLMGPPGTGKSSLLRELVFSHQITAILTYDQRMLSNDEMFVSFLANDGPAILMIEDAEELVSPRERGNSLMSRFLNASDGIIKSREKKIVFTTNQENFRQVDEALLRPGRAFGTLKTRALTYEEACRVAEEADLARPTGMHDYTLGELFNPNRGVGDLGTIGITG